MSLGLEIVCSRKSKILFLFLAGCQWDSKLHREPSIRYPWVIMPQAFEGKPFSPL